VSARTLRHYEAVGLLGVPAHESRNGYRSYGAAELLRGVQIEQLKAAGLSLDEIRRVLDEGATAEAVLANRRRELAAVVRRGQRRLTVLDALARPYADVARPSLTTSDRAQVVSERVTPAAGDLGPAVRTGIQRLRRQLKRVDPGGSWTFAARFPVDLDVEPGAFLVMVGASGCGKSTRLRLIAGFEQPSEGKVQVGSAAPSPGVTSGVVFQQPRLFPWRTVGGNVELALKYANVPRERRAERRDQLLQRVGLEGTADRKIWEISGGQQQRVAIARALAAETPLFLLDEPFAALDALTRERLQEDVRQVSAESGRTTVFVTHSADEAAFLGSRIVVLTRRPGQVALDLPVDLPRLGVDPDELRRSPEYTRLRAEVGRAVKAAAA